MTHGIQGLLITGAIFKQTIPDESDEERRALERWVLLSFLIFYIFYIKLTWLPLSRMVAEAATPKKRRREKHAIQHAIHGRDVGSSTSPTEPPPQVSS